MEQRDINNIFDLLEIYKDNINLKEISTEKLNKDYSISFIKLYKNIYIYNRKQNNNGNYPFLKIKMQGILFLN